MFTADRPSLITRWSADCQVVGVKFDAEYLEREADRVRAAPLRSQLLFPHQLDLGGPDEQTWFALVRALSAQVRKPADLLAARWGFSSPSRFAAAYRKRDGIAPSEHRRSS